MNTNPTRFALHAMYNSFINTWGKEYAPDFKRVESDWVELTSGLGDQQVREMSNLITDEMTGFPGTVQIKKYAVAVKNNVDVEPSIEEEMAMEIINYVSEKFPGKNNKYTVSDALEIAASVFYVLDHSGLETEQEATNQIHIMPRKSTLLLEASKWVTDSCVNKGRWLSTIQKIQEVYDA